jgi:hypothetical protein
MPSDAWNTIWEQMMEINTSDFLQVLPKRILVE